MVTGFTFAALFDPDTPVLVDGIGFVASILTLVAFAQKVMLPMRIAAIAANVFFIAYGVMGPYPPVLALHLILLPLNVVRLIQLLRSRSGAAGNAEGETAGLVLLPAAIGVCQAEPGDLS
jgi:hypothetical protein